MICPLLASHPEAVATAFKRLLLHAKTLQLRNPLIMQQVLALLATTVAGPSDVMACSTPYESLSMDIDPGRPGPDMHLLCRARLGHA